MRRLTPFAVAAIALLLAGCGADAATVSAASSSTTTAAAASTTETGPAPSTTDTQPTFPPVASIPAPLPVPTTDATPAGFTCSQVGGVFQQNYPDGRGDCIPADPRPACHVPPDQQPDNYLAVLTLDPPSADGLVEDPASISLAANADCWHNPLG